MADDIDNQAQQQADNAKKSARLLRAEESLQKKKEKLLAAELTEKQRDKADRLRAKRDAMANRGMLRRMAGKAVSSGMKGVGSMLGGVPIAGAMVRAMANSSAKKDSQDKKLIRQRDAELKLQEDVEKAEKEVEKRSKEPIDKSPMQNMADAVSRLEIAIISFAPFVTTTEDIAVKMEEAVDRFASNAHAQRVHDSSLANSLQAVESIGEEMASMTSQIVEKVSVMGKDIGNIKWHMARANGSAGRIEKMMKEAEKVEQREDSTLKKDVGNIKWHMARANGSVGRIEKMMKEDRSLVKEQIENQKEDKKIQEKQLALQEESLVVGLAGVLTNMLSGSGLGKMLGGMARAAPLVIGAVAAWEIGQAIGEQLYKWLSQFELFHTIGDKFGRAVDHILDFFGDEDAAARLKTGKAMEMIENENQSRKSLGLPALTPEEEAYTHRNGEVPYYGKDRFLLQDEAGSSMNPANYSWYEGTALEIEKKKMELAERVNRESAEVEDAKGGNTAGSSNTVANQTNINNSNTSVLPGVLSTEPRLQRRPLDR